MSRALSRVLTLIIASHTLPLNGLRAQAPVNWSESLYEVSLPRGTTKATTLIFESSQPLKNISLFVTPAISGFISIENGGNTSTFPSGVAASLSTRITIPESTQVGDYEGTIHVRSGGATVPNVLKILIHVIVPSTSSVPVEFAFPSPDRIAVTSSGVPIVRDEILLGIEFGLPNQNQLALQIAQATNGVVIGSNPDLAIYQIRYAVDDPTTLDSTRSALANMQHVEFASFHFFSSISDTPPPTDPRFLDGSQWGLQYVGIPKAWDIQTGSSSVVVAVIDRNFDAGHPDLKGNVTTPDLPPPSISDLGRDHGTHVAGLVGGVGNNGIGIAGVNWRTSLRLYGCASPSNPLWLDSACVAGSMVSAAIDGARVVNLSTSSPGARCGIDPPADVNTLEQALMVAKLWAKAVAYVQKIGRDVLWVFAAGNGCRDASNESGPIVASLFPQNSVAVASVGRTGALSTFSNFGTLVNVAAPGEDILSTLPRSCVFSLDILCNPLVEIYGYLSGTSQAAPFVSGLAALVLSQHPTFTATQTKQCIVAAAQQFGAVVSGQPFRVISAPESVTCAPMRQEFAFVANGTGTSDNVWSYTIEATTGALTPVINPATGSPGFTTPGGAPGSFSVAVDPVGNFIYVANLVSSISNGNISGYRVDPTTGVLTPVNGSPFLADVGPFSIVVHPSGRFVYVGNEISGDVSAYTADSTTGTLRPMASSPFSLSVERLAIDPLGRFLVGLGTDVRTFRIDPTTGAPTLSSSSAAAFGPVSAAFDPTGRFVYVANLSGGVSAYTIDSNTGVLMSIAGSPFVGVSDGFSIVVDPTGKFVYVTNANPSKSISAYTINPSTGALTPVTGSPYPTAGCPVSLTVDQSGQFLYAAETCGSNNILGYRIDPLNGALTPLVGSPFPAGGEPLSIAVSRTIP